MNEGPRDPALQELLADMADARRAVQQALALSPEDVQLHRIHGMYAGQILDIRKVMLQEAALDRDQLLIAALKTVVRYLLDEGEHAAARFLGDRLEDIGQKVKEHWQDSKVFPDLPADTKKSGGSSPRPSRPSARPRRTAKRNAAAAPDATSDTSPKPISRTT